jgi:hypothetical protein
MSVTSAGFDAVMADVATYARFAGMLTQTPDGVGSARELLETVNRRLADVVADPSLPSGTYITLVELRDLVGAHLLASASLDDVVPDRARALLARASDAVLRSRAVAPERPKPESGSGPLPTTTR